MIEIWKPVIGYEGLYEVSNLGRVKSLKYLKIGKEKILKERIHQGYNRVILFKNGIGKEHSVHRLVWNAFNGDIPKGLVINHLNEIKSDNRLCNLEMCTPKENSNYGTGKVRGAVNRTRYIKLTEMEDPSNVLIISAKEAQEQFGYTSPQGFLSTIYRAQRNGRNYANFKGKNYYFSHESCKEFK
jgi:hypothetical protein